MSANQSPECGQDLYRESQEPSSLGANHKSPLLCYTKHKEVQTACSNTIISPGKNRNFNLTHAPKKKKDSVLQEQIALLVGWLSSGLQQILNHLILKLSDEEGKGDTFTQHCHHQEPFLAFCTSSRWVHLGEGKTSQ